MRAAAGAPTSAPLSCSSINLFAGCWGHRRRTAVSADDRLGRKSTTLLHATKENVQHGLFVLPVALKGTSRNAEWPCLSCPNLMPNGPHFLGATVPTACTPLTTHE